MSPANVYRFFASKNAIVEAICQRCLSELDDKAWAVARVARLRRASGWRGCSSKSSTITART